MTYATEVAKSTRQHFTAVEIDLERCALSYGTAPCGAILGVTGVAKCYNTNATCQSKANYTQTAGAYTGRKTTFRFVQQEVPPYGATCVQRACLKSVSMSPGRLDLGGSTLGQRETCTVNLFDGTGDDIQADDYSDPRRGLWDNGWLLAKIIARWRYFGGRELRVIDGFLDVYGSVDTTSLRTRTYVVDKLTGPDGMGTVTIVAKDPLRATATERSQFPKASVCALTIAALVGDVTLTTGITTDLDTTGYIRIEDEIIKYTGKTTNTVTGCTRGYAGTTAAAHAIGKNCQRTVEFLATSPVEIVYQVLSEIGVATKYMSKPAWHTACDDWIELTAITAYVSAPEDADKLLASVCEAWLLILYYDSLTASVQLIPARPALSSELIDLSEDNNVLMGKMQTSEKTDQRINQLWVYYGVTNWAKAVDFANLTYLSVLVDVDAQSVAQYGDTRPRLIKTRWLSNVTSGQVNSILARYMLRFRDPPKRYSFSVDGSAQIKLGSFLRITVANIQNPDGSPLTRVMRAVEVGDAAGGAQISVVAEDDFFQGRYGFFTTDTAADFNTLNDSLNAGNGFFCSDYDIMPNGTPPFLFA